MNLWNMALLGFFIIICLYLGQFLITIFFLIIGAIFMIVESIWNFIKKLF